MPYLVAYDDFYDRLGHELWVRLRRIAVAFFLLIDLQDPLVDEEPIEFRYENVSKSTSSTDVPSSPIPQYSSLVKEGLLSTISSAALWRQRLEVRIPSILDPYNLTESILTHSA